MYKKQSRLPFVPTRENNIPTPPSEKAGAAPNERRCQGQIANRQIPRSTAQAVGDPRLSSSVPKGLDTTAELRAAGVKSLQGRKTIVLSDDDDDDVDNDCSALEPSAANAPTISVAPRAAKAAKRPRSQTSSVSASAAVTAKRKVSKKVESNVQDNEDAVIMLDQTVIPPKKPMMTQTAATKRSMPPPVMESAKFDLGKRKLPWKTEDERPSRKSLSNPNLTTGHRKQVFTLSVEQRKVLKMVVDNKISLFFTGSAGTGKSVLLREIIQKLKCVYKNDIGSVAVTASTGIAACNIGGTTLHSFAGIGLGVESKVDLTRKVKKNRVALGRWTKVKVLIIDEVSMIDGELFDKLEHIARSVRSIERPFGGIQLVITGDFFQLPPVSKGDAKFCFEAESWKKCLSTTVMLTQVYRQSDTAFVRMLNEIRLGRLTDETTKTFLRLSRPLTKKENIEPTELFSMRHQVEAANKRRLDALEGPVHLYKASDSGTAPIAVREQLLTNSCLAPKEIQLKLGSQVMLIKNLSEDNLVNGSLGKVVGFQTRDGVTLSDNGRDIIAPPDYVSTSQNFEFFPLVEFLGGRTTLASPETWKIELPNGECQASRSQVPLILAWAISIHKSQGQTLEFVKVDLGKVFEKGQAYVALSRATSLDGLQVLNFTPGKVMAHPKVKTFYDQLGSADDFSNVF